MLGRCWKRWMPRASFAELSRLRDCPVYSLGILEFHCGEGAVAAELRSGDYDSLDARLPTRVVERVRYRATASARQEGLTGTSTDSSGCRTLREDQRTREWTRVDAGRGKERSEGPGPRRLGLPIATQKEQQRAPCPTARRGKMTSNPDTSNSGPMVEVQRKRTLGAQERGEG